MKTTLLAVLSFLPCLAFADSTTDSTTTSPSTVSPTTTAHSPSVTDPNKELATMTQRLNLTPNQQDEIKPILVAEAQKREEILSDTTLTSIQKHDQLGAEHRASLQQIKAYFTPDQMTQIEQGQNHHVASSTNPGHYAHEVSISPRSSSFASE